MIKESIIGKWVKTKPKMHLKNADLTDKIEDYKT